MEQYMLNVVVMWDVCLACDNCSSIKEMGTYEWTITPWEP